MSQTLILEKYNRKLEVGDIYPLRDIFVNIEITIFATSFFFLCKFLIAFNNNKHSGTCKMFANRLETATVSRMQALKYSSSF